MKTVLTALTLTLTVVASAQDHHTCAPEELRAAVMNLLKGIDSTKFEAYNALFMTEKEYELLIANADLNEDEKQIFLEDAEQKSLNAEQRREFLQLIFDGRRTDLNWKNIEYTDFLYKLRLVDGEKMLTGTIYFTDGEDEYEIHLRSYFVNDTYRLTELGF